MDADPKQRSELEKVKRAYDLILGLAALHHRQGRRPTRSPESFGVSSEVVSQLERREDLCISTLRDTVESLGGRLEITAVFPEQRIRLGVPTSSGREDETKQ